MYLGAAAHFCMMDCRLAGKVSKSNHPMSKKNPLYSFNVLTLTLVLHNFLILHTCFYKGSNKGASLLSTSWQFCTLTEAMSARGAANYCFHY